MPALSQAGPLVGPALLASGWTVYTVPTGKVWRITGWDQVNKHASTSETTKIAIGASDDDHLVQPPTVIAAGDHWPRYRGMDLRAGQTLRINAATGNLVVFTVHGLEITA